VLINMCGKGFEKLKSLGCKWELAYIDWDYRFHHFKARLVYNSIWSDLKLLWKMQVQYGLTSIFT